MNLRFTYRILSSMSVRAKHGLAFFMPTSRRSAPSGSRDLRRNLTVSIDIYERRHDIPGPNFRFGSCPHRRGSRCRLLNGDFFNGDGSFRAIAGISVHLGDRIRHVLAFRDLAEDGVVAVGVEEFRVGHRDEEL